jgi:hypothetical protein
MNRVVLTKLITAGSMLSIALSLYVLFGNHNWFGDRADLRLDLADLAETPTGPKVLARYQPLNLRCKVEPSPLGAQACWGDIGSFNGIPARHVTFYFDARQNLTAWKLAAEASQHAALQRHFELRFGPADTDPGRAFVTHSAGPGLLALDAEAPLEGETSVLWLLEPAAIRGLHKPPLAASTPSVD